MSIHQKRSIAIFYFITLLVFSDSGSGLGFCGFISREIVASSPILGRSTPLDTPLPSTLRILPVRTWLEQFVLGSDSETRILRKICLVSKPGFRLSSGHKLSQNSSKTVASLWFPFDLFQCFVFLSQSFCQMPVVRILSSHFFWLSGYQKVWLWNTYQ